MEKINKYDLKPIKNIDNLNGEDYIFFETLNDAKNTPKSAIKRILNGRKKIKEKDEEILKLKIKSEKDYLTGLYSREGINTKFLQKINSLSRGKIESLGIGILDIDDFKKINDTYGHHVGDITLVKLSEILSNFFRNYDIVGRIGGEEFLILIDGLNYKELKEKLTILTKTIKNKLVNNVNKVQKGPKIKGKITATIGFTNISKENIDLENPENTIEKYSKEADIKLFEGKTNGKNGAF